MREGRPFTKRWRSPLYLDKLIHMAQQKTKCCILQCFQVKCGLSLRLRKDVFVFCFRDNILSTTASYKRLLVLVFSHCKLTLSLVGKNNTPLPFSQTVPVNPIAFCSLHAQAKLCSLGCDNNLFFLCLHSILIKYWNETLHSLQCWNVDSWTIILALGSL